MKRHRNDYDRRSSTQPSSSTHQSTTSSHQPSLSERLTSARKQNPQFDMTHSYPHIFFTPVSAALAEDRLTALDRKSRIRYRQSKDQMRRYTFDDKARIVDNGVDDERMVKALQGHGEGRQARAHRRSSEGGEVLQREVRARVRARCDRGDRDRAGEKRGHDGRRGYDDREGEARYEDTHAGTKGSRHHRAVRGGRRRRRSSSGADDRQGTRQEY